MASRAKLAAVPDPEQEIAQEHMRERIIREALEMIDRAQRELRKAEAIIALHGRDFINARYAGKGERVFTKPTVDRLRRELGV